MRLRDRRLAEARDRLAPFGIRGLAARSTARRALSALEEFDLRQRQLNDGDPDELLALVDALPVRGDPPPPVGGALLLTLHYGPFPLLWLWLKRAAHRGKLPPFTLFYSTDEYANDLTPEGYARLAALDAVPAGRDDIDLAALGARRALVEARRRLSAGGAVLIFPDATNVSHDSGRPLICRIGTASVAFPGGAASLAATPGLRLQGVALRRDGIVWSPPSTTPATHDQVEHALQALLDLTVERDPARWLKWVTPSSAS